MCTAVVFRSGDGYFGRNLDLERGYGEQVVITPRGFSFDHEGFHLKPGHYAMIGMATVAEGFPLYYEAANEKGLCMAGLNFPGNAWYGQPEPEKENVPPYAFIPWVLGQCGDLDEAERLLLGLRLVREDFSPQLPVSPLHWMISDKKRSIVVESVQEGLKIWDNPFEVLTNNPPFDYHRMHLNDYMALGVGAAVSKFSERCPLHNYSLGMGALGLPGDFSSASRFVKAFFVKENSKCPEEEGPSVHQFFHILNSVAMPKGCVWTEHGYEYTRYSCCCNMDRGIYYYTTYDGFEIRSVSLHDMDLDGAEIQSQPVTGLEEGSY